MIWSNVVFVLKLVLAEWMFAHTYKRRSRFPLRAVLALAACVLLAWVYPYEKLSLFPGNVLIFAVFFGATAAGLLFCCNVPIWNILFAGIAGYLTEHFCSQGGNMLRILVSRWDSLSSGSQDALCNLIPVLAVYPLFYWLFARRIRRGEHPNVDNKRLILISGVTLFLCIFVSSISMGSWRYLDGLPASAQAVITGVGEGYAMLCCLVVLMLLFGILTQSRLRSDLSVMEHLLYQEKEQYRISRENIERINIKCHDLKHQIASLRENASEESIREIEQAVLIYDSVVKTGNDALDVILTEKSLYCQENGIRFNCMVDGDKLDCLEISDLYSLFGNLVDNALEAVSALDDPGKRDLSLIVRQERQFLVIWVENYYAGDLRFEDGLPLTTKADREYHGFGLKSIRMLVEKYGGSLLIDTGGQVFRLKIVLPMKKLPDRK